MYQKKLGSLFCIDYRQKRHFKRCSVQVAFEEGMSIQQITEKIKELATPQIIVWYIGCDGLRKAGVQFYKNCLISPVLNQHTQATFWLVDLTGWNAFKNSHGSIHKANNCCDRIESFLDANIKCIRSSKIFKKMQDLEIDLIEYFRKALQRDFICKTSIDFPDKNIRVREIFSDYCPVMSNWYDNDVSKSYSVFQYLEGCLLIDEIFVHLIRKNITNYVQIVFAIPNDEINYYRDELESFKNDVEFLISKRCKLLNLCNINLQIKFLAFKYGSEPHHRPYNAPGNVLKMNDLFYKDIVSYCK